MIYLVPLAAQRVRAERKNVGCEKGAKGPARDPVRNVRVQGEFSVARGSRNGSFLTAQIDMCCHQGTGSRLHEPRIFAELGRLAAFLSP